MQRAFQSVVYGGGVIKAALVSRVGIANPMKRLNDSMRHQLFTSATTIEEHGFESTCIADILTAKGKSADGSWLWCTTDDTVYDAVKSVCFSS